MGKKSEIYCEICHELITNRAMNALYCKDCMEVTKYVNMRIVTLHNLLSKRFKNHHVNIQLTIRKKEMPLSRFGTEEE